jgi:hypothetical protein
MDSTDSVVRQDKGNESLRPAMPGLRCFPYDFRASHCDTSELVVTHRNWVTVTRAISGSLQNSWQRTQPIWSAITALIAGSILLVLFCISASC